MLRRHQCCINLKRNCLVVGTSGEAVPFLSDGDIPKSFTGGQEESQEDDEAIAKALAERPERIISQ